MLNDVHNGIVGRTVTHVVGHVVANLNEYIINLLFYDTKLLFQEFSMQHVE